MNRRHPDGLLFPFFIATLLAAGPNAQAANGEFARVRFVATSTVASCGQAIAFNQNPISFDRTYGAGYRFHAVDFAPVPAACQPNVDDGSGAEAGGSASSISVHNRLNVTTGETQKIPLTTMALHVNPDIHQEYSDTRSRFEQPPILVPEFPEWASYMAAPQLRVTLPAQLLVYAQCARFLKAPDWSVDSRKEEGVSVDTRSMASGGVEFDGVNLVRTFALLGRLRPYRPEPQGYETALLNPASAESIPPEHYHWGGLLAQSLLFNVIENGFRTASDDQIRTLLATKPFWHDYAASMQHFNMRRWNDGDDFLVNYVGHPMQGAVSGFIEIQNDPRGRDLEISATRNYWESRFKAFLWATAYSTHSEISPIGEAGIGNEGGWTYPLNCKGNCTAPGSYKEYTNNTGWVDFIVTPTVGTLWLLAEDTLDRYVSDRVQGEDRSRIMPKILRGTLNPSRTMANALRFRAPWYRDSQQDAAFERSYGVHSLPSDDEIAAAGAFRRISFAPYFHTMPFGSPSMPCFFCMQSPGVGFAFDYAWARWVGASITVEREPDSLVKGGSTTGSIVNVGMGLRFSYEKPNNIVSFSVRPGIMIGQVDPQPNSQGVGASEAKQLQTIGHGSITLALSNDYKINRLLSMRVSVGNTIFRYSNADGKVAGIGSPPYLSWLSKQEYRNESTWSSEIGPVFRF